MSNNRDDEIDKLKQDMGDLKTLVKFLASAVDKVAESDGVLSETVNELVQAERESLAIQEKLVLASLTHSEKLDKLEGIESGIQDIQNILRRLGSSLNSENGK